MEVYSHAEIPGYRVEKDVTGGDPQPTKVRFADYGGMLPYCIKTARPGREGFMLFDESVTREAVLHLKDYFEVLIWTRYQGERPLLFEVSYKTPHWPFIAPPELYEHYRARVELPRKRLPADAPPALRRSAASHQTPEITEEEVLNARAGYWGLVEWLDAQIGIVLAALDETGLRDEFIILYTSDHGEMAGEYGLWNKGVMYEESVRVPMILAGPGIPAGVEVRENVSQMDVFPTLTELAGLPPPEGIRGRSMLPLLEKDAFGERTVTSEIFHETDSLFMAKRGDAKYVEYSDGAEQLFDLGEDPDELVDRAGDPACAEVKDELSRTLAELPEPRRAGRPDWRAARARP